MSRKKPETGAGLRGDWGSPELGQKEIRIQTVRIVKQEMENFRFMKILSMRAIFEYLQFTLSLRKFQ